MHEAVGRLVLFLVEERRSRRKAVPDDPAERCVARARPRTCGSAACARRVLEEQDAVLRAR